MSALRFAVVVLCIAGLAAAQGGFTSCPSAQSTSDDYFAAQSCDAFKTCATTRCTCNGGTFSSTTLTCSASGKTCADASACERTFVQCMQSASSASCLTSLKVALVNVLAGTTYSGSALQLACKADTCRYLNATVSGNCSIDYDNICYLNGTGSSTVAPGKSKFRGRLIMTGEFIIIIASPTKLFIFIQALNLDLTVKLLVQCNVSALVAGSGVATFDANTDSTDAAFLARVTAASTDSSWLTNAAAQFAALGGTGTFGISSLTATSGVASTTLYAWSAFAAIVLAVLA